MNGKGAIMYYRLAHGLWIVSVLAGTAAAQIVDTELRFQVRHFDSGHNSGWADTITAVPGNHIEVRAVVTFTGTASVVALGQITFQPLVAGWSSSDQLISSGVGAMSVGPLVGHVPDEPGAYGRITPWATSGYSTSSFLRGHIHNNPDGSGLTYLRIARADVTNWIGVGPTSGGAAINNTTGGGGVTINQGTIGSARPANLPPQVLGTQNLIVFKFGFVLGNGDGVRTLEVSGWLGPSNDGSPIPPPFTEPPVRWHISENSPQPGAYQSYAAVERAAIHVLPSPTTLAVVGILIVMHRRKRA